MDITVVSLGILGWFLVGCLVSYYARRKTGRSISEFFIAGRKISGFIAALTYSATTYSAFMMVGLVGMSYAVGVGAMGFELTYLVSTVLILLYFAPLYWSLAEKYKCVTPCELLSKRYGSNVLGGVVAIYSLFMLIPYVSVQFTGIGYLFEGLIGIPYLLGIAVVFAIVITYTLWAGMRSVAWTDALQSFIMIVSSVMLLLYIIYSKFGGFVAFFATLHTLHPELLSATNISYQKFVGLSVPWMFFALTNPQVLQRVFIVKDRKDLGNMIIGFSVFGFIYTFIVVNIGLAAKCMFPDILRVDTVTARILSGVPILLSLLVFISIVAASVSTVDSIILTLSSMCTVDVFGKLSKVDEKKRLFFGRLMVPLIAVLAFLFAMGKFGIIVEISVMSSAGLLATAPSYVGIFWRRATKMGSLVSMLSGGTVTIVMYLTKYFPFGVWPGVWCAIVSAIIFVVVSLMDKES